MSFADDFSGLPQPGGIQWNQDRSAGMVQYSDPRQQFVFFYRRSVEDPIASRANGRRICKGMDYVRIQPPGERLTVIDRPVTEDDKRRWSQQWYQYANNHQQTPDGTPIDMLWPDHPEVGDNLRACGVHTIEQCAQLSADALQSIGMGAQEYQTRAQRYLEQSQKGVTFQKFNAEIASLEQKNRLLQTQLEQVMAENKRILEMLQGAQMGAMPHGGYQPTVPVYAGAGIPPPPGALMAGPPVAIVDVQTQQINSAHASREEGTSRQKRTISEETRAKMRAAWDKRRAAASE
jgi:hypothetical protein